MTYKSSILQFLPKAIKNFNIICHVENWQINSICRMCIIAEKRVEVSDRQSFYSGVHSDPVVFYVISRVLWLPPSYNEALNIKET